MLTVAFCAMRGGKVHCVVTLCARMTAVDMASVPRLGNVRVILVGGICQIALHPKPHRL
jgi:hypothetical protein